MCFTSTVHPDQPSPRPCLSVKSNISVCTHNPNPLRNVRWPSIHFVRQWVFVISFKSEFEQSTSHNITYTFFHPGVDKRAPASSCTCSISDPLDKAVLPVTLLQHLPLHYRHYSHKSLSHPTQTSNHQNTTHTGLGTELSSSSSRLSTLGRTSSIPRAPFRFGFSFVGGAAFPPTELLLSGTT